MMHKRSPSILALVAGSALLLAPLAGCDGEAPGAAAVKQAGERLAVLTTAVTGSGSPAEAERASQLRAVAQGVQPYTSSPAAGVAAGANLITGRVNTSLAEMKAAEAADLERQVQNELVALAALGDAWTVQSARAAEAAAYDAGPAVAALDKSASEVEAAIGKAAADQRAAEERVAALEKEAAAILAQSRAKRDQAAELKSRVQSASATEGLALLQQSAAVAREADALDLQAHDVRGRAFSARPAVDAAVRQAQMLKSRRDSIKKLRDALLARAASAKESAADTRSAADAAASKLAATLDKAEALRSGDLATATDAAAKSFRDALASAKKAQQGVSGDSRSAAAMTAAAAQHGLADVLMVRARGIQSYAGVLAGLAAAKPPLPNKARIDQLVSPLAAAWEESLRDAREAYTAALSAYETAGGRGQTADRIKTITDILTQFAATPAAAPADSVAVPADGAPAVDAADPVDETEAVRAVLTTFKQHLDAGNVDMALGSFNARTPEQQDTVMSVVAPGLSLAALDKALLAKFNAGLGEILSSNPMLAAANLGSINKAGAAYDLDPASAEVTITEPGKATVTGPGGGPGLMLEKIGTGWLITVPSVPPAMKGPMKAMFTGLGDVATELTPQVRDGKFATRQDFLNALMEKLGPIMQNMLPGGGMPPGGG